MNKLEHYLTESSKAYSRMDSIVRTKSKKDFINSKNEIYDDLEEEGLDDYDFNEFYKNLMLSTRYEHILDKHIKVNMSDSDFDKISGMVSSKAQKIFKDSVENIYDELEDDFEDDEIVKYLIYLLNQ